MKGYLILENGRVFQGKLLNDCVLSPGEVVFTTAMISYQDIITDPSYYGQIVVMTYPLVGNVGFNARSFASRSAMVQGLVLRELTDFPSHWEMDTDIVSFLKSSEVAVLTEVDTRALTRVIRNEGVMGGVISDHLDDVAELQRQAASLQLSGDQVQYVSRRNIMRYGEGHPRIVMLDLGSKRGVLESFTRRGCELIAAPARSTAEAILALQPQGVYISDGPGDPRAISYAVETVQRLSRQVPLFGVGLGHQVIAQALGAKIKKLEHGHRGGNHPVRDLNSSRVYITTQNHGYAVDESSLSPELTVTLRSLNDDSVEGLRHQSLPINSVQFDPEGYVGYSETGRFFEEFISYCRK